MTILRTDKQADSLEILKLIIETADYYRAMAEMLTEDNLDTALAKISRNRATFIAPFQNIVEQLDELPARPDPDKELMQQLGGQITKLFSADSTNAILDKCLHEDEKLADLIRHTTLGENAAEFQKQLDALSDDLNNTKKLIQTLKN